MSQVSNLRLSGPSAEDAPMLSHLKSKLMITLVALSICVGLAGCVAGAILLPTLPILMISGSVIISLISIICLCSLLIISSKTNKEIQQINYILLQQNKELFHAQAESQNNYNNLQQIVTDQGDLLNTLSIESSKKTKDLPN
ncbi:hypothetical protein SBV42_00405 [Chlamydia crocodili]|uniref:Inclusion membrane protein n=1 Tax=Chlamydia crocodili TaxID=2766982 RepID=A0ABX8CF40_9CHLA|nr:hypothetical protein [Chlamydia crocodili]QVE49231.1 hypothetical protein H9Q19_00775 [Chlamydia crocodili]